MYYIIKYNLNVLLYNKINQRDVVLNIYYKCFIKYEVVFINYIYLEYRTYTYICPHIYRKFHIQRLKKII